MSEVLDRIATSLAAIERRLGEVERRLDGVVATASPVIGTAVDAFDAQVADLAARGIDVDVHVRGALALSRAVTAPDVVAVVQRLLGRLDALDAATAALAQGPALAGTLVDTVDHLVARLADAGIDVDARLRALLIAAERLTRTDTLDAVGALLDSGLFGADAVAVLGKVGAAVADAGGRAPTQVGAFGMLRALRDPDVQRAAGFLIQVARGLGKQLDDAPQVRALPA